MLDFQVDTHNEILILIYFSASGVLLLGVGAGIAATTALLMMSKRESEYDENVAYALAPELSTAMKRSQPTPFSDGNEHAAFVTIYLSSNADLREVARAAAKLQDVVAKISPEAQEQKENGEGAIAGVGFSPEAWEQLDRLVPGLGVPSKLRHHKARSGPYGDMPNTGGEIFLHVKSKTSGLAFEVVRAFVNSLPRGSVARVEDGYSFTFQTNRDLTGFQDGTMNASGEEERAHHALIRGEKHSDGGAFIIHQRWLHNERELHKLPIPAQEAVIGRTKEASAELDPLPKSSHVHRTSSRIIRDANGNEVKIVRQSMPFGTVGGDHGLLFCAYSDDVSKFDRQLDRMVGAEDGIADATMKYSKCVRSSYWYAPNVDQLRKLN
jgi:porphyrinogen peroxidase